VAAFASRSSSFFWAKIGEAIPKQIAKTKSLFRIALPFLVF
jgi:hypothetical protein